MGEVRLEIPARADYLGLARQVVAAAAAVEPTFRDERIDDLRIAVSEATTNAIEAHADLDRDERIVIRCNLGDDCIVVEVMDRGSGFDPDEVEAMPDAEDPARLQHVGRGRHRRAPRGVPVTSPRSLIGRAGPGGRWLSRWRG